jgi:hypothetical protein
LRAAGDITGGIVLIKQARRKKYASGKKFEA